MAPQKKNLKEHYDDGTLDLSVLGLQEVPVKDIAAIPKAINLDLSCNSITTLPKSFASSLTHLVKLELSKNQLRELPENFGLLINLKHLDLEDNKLVSLPLSLGQLKSLRWLDLKQNPLMPKLAQIAGQCLDAKQCQAAARSVVAALREMQTQVEAEISRRKETQQKKLDEEEEILKLQNKENQQPKKKKKKAKKAEANKQANGQTHSENQDSAKINKEETHYEETVVSNNQSAQKAGFLRKVGRTLSTLLKVIVMSTLLVLFCGFLLSLFNEDLYITIKKRVNDMIQSNVPKPYLKQWERGLAVTQKTVSRLSEQIVTISVDWYGKMYDYFVTLSDNETVQQFLESIKSGWHIIWIQIGETVNELPKYYSQIKGFFSNASSSNSEKITLSE